MSAAPPLKKKRMTADEKRAAILQVYHSSKDVYTEKEILRVLQHIPKAEDIHNMLIDDGLIDKEKIGGSNYFWSFPSKADYIKQVEHEQNLQRLEGLQEDLVAANKALQQAQEGRNDADDRVAKLARLQELRQQQGQLQAELATLRENDPQAIRDLQHELSLVTQGAYRWTDNLWNCQSYLVKKRGMDKRMAVKLLGISADLDYPEMPK